MNSFKYVLSILLLLGIAAPTFAQKGFKVIRKAEQKHEIGQNNKALRLLSKADKMNYGWCGNAWMEADRAINLLKADIYIYQKKYQLARNCLDSVYWGFEYDNIDSIRIRTYQLEFGKDSLSHMIDSSLKNSKIKCNEHDCFVVIPLSNGKEIRLKPKRSVYVDLIYMDEEENKVETWIALFKRSENYKLIKETD